ncbi:TIGR04283 family arsenosugar biosynthesis glycosyltransferase [Terasakiella pusilla]|uniref:TIGR04283 family arsenosugar biosynthesis glycosyltransferase n=1 Tax=Terasakiella pusilla TaxID=64973 RepID=UPI003AA854A6
MLSIVIPTYNSSVVLKQTIQSVQGKAGVGEILIVDGGSTDDTAQAAAELGARCITAPKGRGSQLKTGAEAAVGAWLLFLHADTVLEEGWERHVGAFMNKPENENRAGYFTFTLNEDTKAARRLERVVARRCTWLGLPYGDQGLLIHQSLYEEVGGYADIPLMEDVDMVRKIGKDRLVPVPVRAVTSASKYQKSGYLKRMLRNVSCLTLYFLGVSPERIVKLYG